MPLDIVLSLSFVRCSETPQSHSGSGAGLDAASPKHAPRLRRAFASGAADGFGKVMFTGPWRKSFWGPSPAYAA